MNTPDRCSLPRRLAAIVYDALVVTAVLFFAAVPVVLLHGGAVEESIPFRVYLVAVAFAFFGGFWTHGGQTIGMRAWRVWLVRDDGGPVRWRDAALRYVLAVGSWLPVAAGFLWALIDRDSRAWHDRFSGTHLVHVPRQRRAAQEA